MKFEKCFESIKSDRSFSSNSDSNPYDNFRSEDLNFDQPTLKLSCNANGTPLFVFPIENKEQKLHSNSEFREFQSSKPIPAEERSALGNKTPKCSLVICDTEHLMALKKHSGTSLSNRHLLQKDSKTETVSSDEQAHVCQFAKCARNETGVSRGKNDLRQEFSNGDVHFTKCEPLNEVSSAMRRPCQSFLKKSAPSDNLNKCLNAKSNVSLSNNLYSRYSLDVDKYFESGIHNNKVCIIKQEVPKCSKETLDKMEQFATSLVKLVLSEALAQSSLMGWNIKCSGKCSQELCQEDFRKRKSSQKEVKSKYSTLAFSTCSSSLCWTPELSLSPSHRSKRSSLSISHDSLVSACPRLDESHLITGAVSHDALSFPSEKSPSVRGDKNKNYSDCLNNDIYTMPIDTVKPYQGQILQPKVIIRQPKHRTQNRVSKSSSVDSSTKRRTHKVKRVHKAESLQTKSTDVGACPKDVYEITRPESELLSQISSDAAGDAISKKTCTSQIASCSTEADMRKPLEEILCDQSSCSSTKHSKRNDERKKIRSLSSNIRNTLVTLFSFKKNHSKEIGNSVNAKSEFINASSKDFYESSEGVRWGKICPLPSAPPLRNCVIGSAFSNMTPVQIPHSPSEVKLVNSSNGPSQRQSTSSISPSSLLSCLGHHRTNSINYDDSPFCRVAMPSGTDDKLPSVKNRALPPLPSELSDKSSWDSFDKLSAEEGCDFASIIEKVKNYGWYWGPISGEAAEKVLSNEPDGSFIVRDSSDYHYIFSLTFRLNGVTRHVRIEHDQGKFSFGGFTRFKSQTIVDFIEKAVDHSRSGRYLFFLHRRPILGPMRVQLLHPVSRFKHVQSLQHLCRFVIVKQVRKDLIPSLPLPQRLKDYLSSPHYYSEQVEQCMSSEPVSTKLLPDKRTRGLSSQFPMGRTPGDTILCSSQSSLDRNWMQASALPSDDRDVVRSSPSSPIPLDFATNDWTSSSEDLFCLRRNIPPLLMNPRCQRRSLNLGRSKKRRQRTSSAVHLTPLRDGPPIPITDSATSD